MNKPLPPGTPPLGIIEGYYGKPWSFAAREEVVKRLSPAGYSFYHYAPKADAHLRRQWREDMTVSHSQDLAVFAWQCRHHSIRFGVGLSPYGAHLNFDAETKDLLKRKLEQIDGVDIDDLAILFDDMRGDVPDLAERQAEIVAFCADHSRATQIYVCPSYYSDDPVLDRHFGNRPTDYLEDLGRLLDPQVKVYWTGEEVCSREINPGHLKSVSERLGRKVCLWDNYPVNDSPRMASCLHLRGFTGRPAANAEHLTGHAVNPALQPILSCIPTLTLAQSYRQGLDYCYTGAFERALSEIADPFLAMRMRKDLIPFNDEGLTRLDQTARDRLRNRYAEIDHPAAREILSWLAGEYEASPEAILEQAGTP
jgi:hypothetical protein